MAAVAKEGCLESVAITGACEVAYSTRCAPKGAAIPSPSYQPVVSRTNDGPSLKRPRASEIHAHNVEVVGCEVVVCSEKQVSWPQPLPPHRRRLQTEGWVRDTWDCRKLLGTGAFSRVHVAAQRGSNVECAMKIIDKKALFMYRRRCGSHLRLWNEAEILTGLNHPGIVQTYDWFETETHAYLVMELAMGGDLLHSILEDGHFVEPQAGQLFAQMCEAVIYLHRRGVVHRDLKLENILLTARDRASMRAKLADFGVSRMSLQSSDCRSFCGTVQYVAPEVIGVLEGSSDSIKPRAPQPPGYGRQADMWSLGVVLYIMLCGSPPFEEEALCQQITAGAYEFDMCEWVDVSEAAKDLVRQLLTVSPKCRLTAEQAATSTWLRVTGAAWQQHGPLVIEI
mmetsp:Transcript_113022/g.319765  ORF Transcript_113022/g.319765 Transcript_113022/m.319765 type:complete len:396 (-) Transcript_113022:127-1314(-)